MISIFNWMIIKYFALSNKLYKKTYWLTLIDETKHRDTILYIQYLVHTGSHAHNQPRLHSEFYTT